MKRRRIKINDWVNEKGITELEKALRVYSVIAYVTCIFYPPINKREI